MVVLAESSDEYHLRGFTPETLDQLAAYAWPGNIDELAAMVREAHQRAEGSQVGPGDLPPPSAGAALTA